MTIQHHLCAWEAASPDCGMLWLPDEQLQQQLHCIRQRALAAGQPCALQLDVPAVRVLCQGLQTMQSYHTPQAGPKAIPLSLGTLGTSNIWLNNHLQDLCHKHCCWVPQRLVSQKPHASGSVRTFV